MCKLTTKTVFLFWSHKVAYLIKDNDQYDIYQNKTYQVTHPNSRRAPLNLICSEFYVVLKQFTTAFMAATKGDLLKLREDTHWRGRTTHNND